MKIVVADSPPYFYMLVTKDITCKMLLNVSLPRFNFNDERYDSFIEEETLRNYITLDETYK